MEVYSATYVSETEAACGDLSASNLFATVLVEISVDGGLTYGSELAPRPERSGLRNEFTIEETVTLAGAYPTSGNYAGGNMVRVMGTANSFAKGLDWKCSFGIPSARVLSPSTRWISTEQVLCQVPPGTAGTTVPLKVSVGGTGDSISPPSYTYEPDYTVAYKSGSAIQGYHDQIVTLKASESSLTATDPRCRFNGKLGRVLAHSGGEIRCAAPYPSAITSAQSRALLESTVAVAVEISFNGRDFVQATQSSTATPFTAWSECPEGERCAYDAGRTVQTRTTCTAGTFCPGRGNIKETPCPPGTLQQQQGSTACDACPSGTFCKDYGTTSATTCPAGYICDRDTHLNLHQFRGVPSGSTTGQVWARGLRFPSSLCPPGHFCIAGARKHLNMDSIIGYKHNSYVAMTNFANTAYYTSFSGQDAATDEHADVLSDLAYPRPCSSSHYCISGTAGGHTRHRYDSHVWVYLDGQDLCESGFVCDARASIRQGQDLCSVGYYCPGKQGRPNGAANSMWQCFRGAKCPSRGMWKPEKCGHGKYQDQLQQTSCDNCAPGEICPAVEITRVNGLMAATVCPKGYTCASSEKSFLSLTDECPSGHYCESGTASTAACSTQTCTFDAGAGHTSKCFGGRNHGSQCSSNAECSTACQIAQTDVSACTVGGVALCNVVPSHPKCVVGKCAAVGRCAGGSTECFSNEDCEATSCTGPRRCAGGYFCQTGAIAKYPTCPLPTSCDYGQETTQFTVYDIPSESSIVIDTTLQRVFSEANFPQQCLPGRKCPSTSTSPSAQDCPTGRMCPGITQLLGNAKIESFRTAIVNTGSHFIRGKSPSLPSYDLLSCGNYPCSGGTCSGGWRNGLSCADDAHCPHDFVSLGMPKRCAHAPGVEDTPSSFLPSQHNVPKARPGFIAPGLGNTFDLECAPGTFSEGEGLDTCRRCPAGFICPTVQTVTPTTCRAGYICNSDACMANVSGSGTGAGSCNTIQCPDCNPGLSTEETACPKGYFCEMGRNAMPGTNPLVVGVTAFEQEIIANASGTGGTLAKEPGLCGAQFYCLEGVFQNTLKLTSAGEFDDGFAGYPQRCTKGYFCQDPVDSVTGATHPNDSPRGSTLGATEATKNLLDTDVQWTNSFTPCPRGTYCPTSSESPIRASPGSFVGLLGSDKERKCDVGKYSNTDGAVVCLDCEPGKFNTISGATACRFCSQGKYKTAKDDECKDCPAGRFGTKDSATSIADGCDYTPAGCICTTEGLTVKPEQATCTGVNGTGCDMCPEGFLCIAGTSSATSNNKSPGGYFTREGATGDTLQASGVCPQDVLPLPSLRICSEGKYCARGTTEVTQSDCPL